MPFRACKGEAVKKSSVSKRHKPLKDGRKSKSQMKKMLITFFYIKEGTVHSELTLQSQFIMWI